jgi:hypothetical protein
MPKSRVQLVHNLSNSASEPSPGKPISGSGPCRLSALPALFYCMARQDYLLYIVILFRALQTVVSLYLYVRWLWGGAAAAAGVDLAECVDCRIAHCCLEQRRQITTDYYRAILRLIWCTLANRLHCLAPMSIHSFIRHFLFCVSSSAFGSVFVRHGGNFLRRQALAGALRRLPLHK